ANVFISGGFSSALIQKKETDWLDYSSVLHISFLTALILSLIVCLANIGLALFGFLLFRNPSDF
ncbi:oligosaccharide flippase family protein, partial [bacterium]|nr:oligosaccharide flippase family protein [bacterium]